MSKPILVLGATGKTGKRIVERLNALNQPVRIGSRNAEHAFDWNNPAGWKDVLKGVGKVYISFQPDLAIPSSAASISEFVKIAKHTGVKQLVLLSGRGEKEAVLCEKEVIHSGMDWTIIRASWFMQNFSEGFLLDSILENEVILPTISAKEPFLSAEDIADVATKMLTNNSYAGHTYDLTGPELLSFEETVSKIAAATKRNIVYREVPMSVYVDTLRSYQLPEDYIWLIEYLFTEVLDGRNESISRDVEKLLMRNATTFDNYIKKTNETGIWNYKH